MRQRNSEAFLLDVTDLHDRDRIVTFLSPRYGRKRGVARGARRKYSRYGGQLQLLTRVELTWFERGDRELVRIRDVALVRTAEWLESDLESILLGSYLAEHLVEFAQDNESSEELYRLLRAVTDALAEGADRPAIARYFELWVLRLSGIFGPPGICPQCDRPFSDEGAVLPEGGDSLVCLECAEGSDPGNVRSSPGYRLHKPVLDLLLASARLPPAEFAQIRPSPILLSQMEGLCRSIRRRFLGRDLKSYEVMRRTLQEVGLRS